MMEIEPPEKRRQRKLRSRRAAATTSTACYVGVATVGVVTATDPDVLFWALWAVLAVGGMLATFAYREVKAMMGPGRTLSEVVEAAIAARRLLWWLLACAMTILCVGWPLLTVHWFTGAL